MLYPPELRGRIGKSNTYVFFVIFKAHDRLRAVALEIAETGSILVEATAIGEWSSAARWSLVTVPVVTALAALAWVGFPLRILPFGHTNPANSQYTWLGIKSADRSFIPDWVSWNYSGYESNGKARKAKTSAKAEPKTDPKELKIERMEKFRKIGLSALGHAPINPGN